MALPAADTRNRIGTTLTAIVIILVLGWLFHATILSKAREIGGAFTGLPISQYLLPWILTIGLLFILILKLFLNARR